MVEVLKSLRVHGQGSDKYDNVRIGMTSRLDSIQAAVLIEKLKIFADENAARDRIARRYAQGLKDVAMEPVVPEGLTSVWAQYTIRLRPGQRDGLAAALKAQGIPTAVYYPKPLHRLEAYRRFPVVDNGIPVTDRLSEEVISLPMHPYLDAPTQDRHRGSAQHLGIRASGPHWPPESARDWVRRRARLCRVHVASTFWSNFGIVNTAFSPSAVSRWFRLHRIYATSCRQCCATVADAF